MLKKLKFKYSVYMEMNCNCSIDITVDNFILTVKSKIGLSGEKIERLSPEKSRKIREGIENLGLSTWQKEYSPELNL